MAYVPTASDAAVSVLARIIEAQGGGQDGRAIEHVADDMTGRLWVWANDRLWTELSDGSLVGGPEGQPLDLRILPDGSVVELEEPGLIDD